LATDSADRQTRRYPLIGALAGGTAIVILVIGWLRSGDDELPVPEPIAIRYVDSVAVMPLANQTGEPTFAHIGVGVAEEIITHLSRIPSLKVISRHSAQALAQQDLTPTQLGSALNVGHVVDGSITVDGQILNVSLRYLDARSGEQLWSDTFSGPLIRSQTLQEEVARTATDRVVSSIPGVALPEYPAHRESGGGQEAYLAGRRFLSQRTTEGLKRAIMEFQRAIEIEPDYAPAHADLASAYALAIFYRYDVGIDSYTLAAQSLVFAEHAIALDAELAAGYAARGYLGALVGQSAAAVAEDFERATALQPNAASIPSWRARSLAQQGQFAEAVAEARRAIDLDPLSPGRHIALAELSLQLGDYEQAIASAQLATTLEPRIFRSRAIEARALLLSGNPQRCASLALGPHRVLRATCLKIAGRSAEADAIIEDVLADIRDKNLQVDGATEVVVFEDLAVYYAYRGDVENALFWSARAYAESPAGLEVRVLESELFDRVRDDTEFSTSISAIRGDLLDRVRRDSERFR
jgi:TolB-like protein/tetratricopeptide (TPR) repeat protein